MRRLWFMLAGVAAVLALAPPADAATGKAGWWTRSPVASAPVGGIVVGNAPDGPTTVAAVLVDLGEGVSGARLTLRQSGGAAPAGANIEACIVGAFAPAAGGPLADAPATACRGASVPVIADGDGAVWTADLIDLVDDDRGVVGVAIVPAPGATVWNLEFDAPEVAVGRGASTSSSPTTVEPDPSISESPPATFAPSPEPDLFGSTPALGDTAAPTPGGSPNTHATPATEEESLALRTDTTDAASTPRPNLVAFVALAAVIGVVGGLAHKAATGRLSGSLGDVRS